jgi:hypothetical protein
VNPGENGPVVRWDSWSKSVTNFEARSGQVNEWTIPLPNELIKAIRQKLKDQK